MHAPAAQPIDPALLLHAYRHGVFPMADARDDPEVFWVEPKARAILPLDGLRLSKSLLRTLRRDRFAVTCNAAFDAVIAACAEGAPGRDETWISGRIAASYRALHRLGHAHSIECWRAGELVGGLYGVGFDRVFCGESMFSRASDASKVALAWRKVFSGWLFRNAPSLNVVEHPVYDVWVKDCAMRFPGEEASPAKAASASKAAKPAGKPSAAASPPSTPTVSPTPER